MLSILVPAREETELWDERTDTFITIPYRKEQRLDLEHSLISLRTWESKWHKPFFDKTKPKTNEEVLDYIRCMTLTKNVDLEVYTRLSDDNFKQIDSYIEDPMTATTFSDDKNGKKGRKRVTTAELIYCWMISLGIPFECQKWHINQLLTLIEVCNRENAPGEKLSKRETMSKYAAMNAARRKKYNSKG